MKPPSVWFRFAHRSWNHVPLWRLSAAFAVTAAVHAQQVLDGGGGPQASADYAHDVSLSGMGAASASVNYALAAGFPAQLNNPPVVSDLTRDLSVAGDTQLPLSILTSAAMDPDGDPVELVTVHLISAEGGKVMVSGPWITYLPPEGWSGVDSFRFVVRDAAGETAEGRVLLRSATPPDAPTINLVAVVPDGGDAVRVLFVGIASRVFRLEVTSSLVAPVQWTDLGLVKVDPQGVLELFDPLGALQSQRFYRAVPP